LPKQTIPRIEAAKKYFLETIIKEKIFKILPLQASNNNHFNTKEKIQSL